MQPLSIVFASTGEFGVPILNTLASDPRIKINFVVTGEDKAAGRGLNIKIPPVKQAALLNKLIIQQPSRFTELKRKFTQEKPDFLVVVAYGEILNESILRLPKYGAINIHASLLPQYRGASPIQEAILNGDTATGITWILMNKYMDKGNIIARKQINIAPEDTYLSLSLKLSGIAASNTAEVLFRFAENQKSEPQDDSKATCCRKIKKQDGFIDVKNETAEEILRKIRAYTPWPGCYLTLNGKRIKIVQAKIDEQKICAGEVKYLDKKTVALGTTKDALIPLIVQPESKREMPMEAFLQGFKAISS